MTINFKAPDIKELKPRILVLGIGGAGGNAINGMIEAGLQGVEFIAVNTDAQDLRLSHAQTKIQMGLNLTKGLGAARRPKTAGLADSSGSPASLGSSKAPISTESVF